LATRRLRVCAIRAPCSELHVRCVNRRFAPLVAKIRRLLYQSGMQCSRLALALVLCGTAAPAQRLEPPISRSLVLPRGAVDVTLEGTYTNWSSSLPGATAVDGETLAFGFDFGVADRAQLGLAMALPINPGAGFGSVLGSAAFGAERSVAVRLDAGYEQIGFNGNLSSHTNRFFGGLGVPLKVPITPTVAFVSGRTGAVEFGHFNNIGSAGTGVYQGASALTDASADVFVISSGDNSTSTNFGINLPAGLLLQPDPHLAVTLLAGYSLAIIAPNVSGAQTSALHFLPFGVEAVVTPVPRLDFGARFRVDGYVGQTGGNLGLEVGYFDLRELMFWTRVRL
jgi:hypothetical protein